MESNCVVPTVEGEAGVEVVWGQVVDTNIIQH